MPLNGLQRIPVSNAFERGFTAEWGNDKIQSSQAQVLQNARLNGSVSMVRPGFLQDALNTTLNTTFRIQGIGYNDTLDIIYIVHNKTLYKLNDATSALDIVPLAGGATNIVIDDTVEFLPYGPLTFMYVKGDGMWIIGVNDYSKQKDLITEGTQFPTSFAPQFGVIHRKRQLVAGWDVDSNSNQLFISDFNTQGATDLSNIYTFIFNQSSTGSATTDAIGMSTKIISLQSTMQGIYMFSQRSIEFISDSTISNNNGIISTNSRPLAFNEAPVSHRGVAVAGNSVFFLTQSNKIMSVSFNRTNNIQQVTDISHRSFGISKFMDRMDTNQTSAFALYYPKQRLLKFHMKSEGASFNDTCLTLFIRPDGTSDFIEDTDKFFSAGVTRGQIAYTISDIAPELYRDEEGTSDNGADILFERLTKPFDLGTITHRKEFRTVRLRGGIQLGRSATFQIFVDGSSVTPEIALLSTDFVNSTGGTATNATATTANGSSQGFEDVISFNKIIPKSVIRARGNTIQLKVKSTGAGHFHMEHLEFKAKPLSTGFTPLGEE